MSNCAPAHHSGAWLILKKQYNKLFILYAICTVKVLAPQRFTVHVCTRQLLKRTMPNIQLLHCHIAR